MKRFPTLLAVLSLGALATSLPAGAQSSARTQNGFDVPLSVDNRPKVTEQPVRPREDRRDNDRRDRDRDRNRWSRNRDQTVIVVPGYGGYGSYYGGYGYGGYGGYGYGYPYPYTTPYYNAPIGPGLPGSTLPPPFITGVPTTILPPGYSYGYPSYGYPSYGTTYGSGYSQNYGGSFTYRNGGVGVTLGGSRSSTTYSGSVTVH